MVRNKCVGFHLSYSCTSPISWELDLKWQTLQQGSNPISTRLPLVSIIIIIIIIIIIYVCVHSMLDRWSPPHVDFVHLYFLQFLSMLFLHIPWCHLLLCLPLLIFPATGCRSIILVLAVGPAQRHLACFDVILMSLSPVFFRMWAFVRF